MPIFGRPFSDILRCPAIGDHMPTINEKDSGYRGIWYFNQASGDE